MFIKFLLRPAAKFKILHRNLTPGGRGWRTMVAKLPERPVWKVDLIWYIFHLCCFTMRGWTQHRQHWIYIVTIYFLCPDTQSYKFTQIIYNDPCSFQCNDNDSSALQEILKEYLEVSSDSYLILNLPHTRQSLTIVLFVCAAEDSCGNCTESIMQSPCSISSPLSAAAATDLSPVKGPSSRAGVPRTDSCI